MIRARKRFGQHFLEPIWADKVARAINPQATETFVEIGPGRGALTRPLLARARAVVAFEIDRDLASQLREAGLRNLTVVEGDFLASRWLLTNPLDGRLRVAGNLPYNVASPILFKLGEIHAAGIPIVDATLMLQREVANRLAADSGTREYGALSILIRHTADVEPLFVIPPGAFRPAPKVYSTLVRVRFHAPNPPAHDTATFTALVQAIFTRRRKTIANALRAFPPAQRLGPLAALEGAALDATRRPETLTISELVRLANVFAAANMSPHLPEKR